MHHWQRQLSKRQEALAQARSELARCLSFRGPHGERADCSGLAAAVRQAEQKVQEAQEAIRSAQLYIKHVGEANANFQRQAQRLNTILTSDELPKASALLRKSITILESYIAQMVPPVGRFAHRAGRIATAFAAALVIMGASYRYPFNVTTEIPVPEELPAAITSTEKQMEGAKLVLEVTDDVHQADEHKEKTRAEIEQRLQHGQQGTV